MSNFPVFRTHQTTTKQVHWWQCQIKRYFFSKYTILYRCCSSTAIATLNLSFTEILGMEVIYILTKNSYVKVDIRREYFLQTSHVCKWQKEGWIKKILQNPHPGKGCLIRLKHTVKTLFIRYPIICKLTIGTGNEG